jgi:hypothetical protein
MMLAGTSWPYGGHSSGLLSLMASEIRKAAEAAWAVTIQNVTSTSDRGQPHPSIGTVRRN